MTPTREELSRHLHRMGYEPPEEANMEQGIEYQLHELCHAFTLGVADADDPVAATTRLLDAMSRQMQNFNEALANELTFRALERFCIPTLSTTKVARATMGEEGAQIALYLRHADLDQAMDDLFRRLLQPPETVEGEVRS